MAARRAIEAGDFTEEELVNAGLMLAKDEPEPQSKFLQAAAKKGLRKRKRAAKKAKHVASSDRSAKRVAKN